MKKKILFIVMTTALSILWNACSEDNAPIKTQEIIRHDRLVPLTLKKEKEAVIDMIAKSYLFAKLGKDDEIYLYCIHNQDKNCEVLKMDPELRVKERFIVRGGIGPGEVRNPRIYGGDGRSIIIYDPPGYKYVELTPDFKLIDEYRVKDRGTFLYSGGRYIPGKRTVLDGFLSFKNLFDSSISIYAREIKGAKQVEDIKIFEIPQVTYRKEDRKMIAGKIIHFGYLFGNIYILDKRSYSLVKMDINGSVLKKIKVKFSPKSFSKSEREKWVEEFYGKKGLPDFDYPNSLWPACWLIRIGDGIAVGQCKDYSHQKPGAITADYFDRELNYLGKISLPGFENWNDPNAGQQMAESSILYKNGKLYTLEERDGDTWIVRRDVRFEKDETETLRP